MVMPAFLEWVYDSLRMNTGLSKPLGQQATEKFVI